MKKYKVLLDINGQYLSPILEADGFSFTESGDLLLYKEGGAFVAYAAGVWKNIAEHKAPSEEPITAN